MLRDGDVLFIGGRSGVGKTTVAAELHVQLSEARIRHALVEGDNLDQAWPVPHENGLQLAESNLAAIRRNFQNAGYHRLIYTNTAAVRGEVMLSLLRALGGEMSATAVLLAADDHTTAARLAEREIGSALDLHVQRSGAAARVLDNLAPAWVHRISVDGRTVSAIARDIRALLDWDALPEDR